MSRSLILAIVMPSVLWALDVSTDTPLREVSYSGYDNDILGYVDYIYDDEGRLSRREHKGKDHKAYKLHTCFYEKDRLARVELAFPGEKPYEIRHYLYDRKGRKVAAYTVEDDGDVTDSVVFEYDKKGHEIGKKQYDYHHELEYTYRFGYDADKRLTSIKRFERDTDTLLSHMRREYSDQGLVVREVAVRDEKPDFVVQAHEYDGEGRLLRTRRFGFDGTVQAVTEYRYDSIPATPKPKPPRVPLSSAAVASPKSAATFWLDRRGLFVDGKKLYDGNALLRIPYWTGNKPEKLIQALREHAPAQAGDASVLLSVDSAMEFSSVYLVMSALAEAEWPPVAFTVLDGNTRERRAIDIVKIGADESVPRDKRADISLVLQDNACSFGAGSGIIKSIELQNGTVRGNAEAAELVRKISDYGAKYPDGTSIIVAAASDTPFARLVDAIDLAIDGGFKTARLALLR